MKKLIIILIAAFSLIIATAPALAIDSPICDEIRNNPQLPNVEEALSAAGCDTKPEDDNLTNSSQVRKIANLAFWGIGLLSVIILIYGGIRYLLAQGLASELSLAQHTIIYGIVGLLVSLAGWAVVNFVIKNIGG
ncbi:MAG: hypothetical protein LBM97_01135 [Candidatus Nomurabacteria bacterium]|jgi:hypothetical protein|nr:hypothetical protein [Candidatus Nomurabacteria bacterium]